jgi:hypothetical protein
VGGRATLQNSQQHDKFLTHSRKWTENAGIGVDDLSAPGTDGSNLDKKDVRLVTGVRWDRIGLMRGAILLFHILVRFLTDQVAAKDPTFSV